MILHPDHRLPSFRDEDEFPDPSRLRRERARWPGIEEATRLARITVLHHGGARRPIIHRGSRHARGRIVSRKTGQLQIWEGRGLEFQAKRCETDGAVADYQVHPYRIDMVVDGRRTTWFPDVVWVVRGGRPVVVEVKHDEEHVGDDEYKAKLAAMAELARRIGWTFRLLYSTDIFGDPNRPVLVKARRENVLAVHSRRFLTASSAEERRIDAFVGDGIDTMWGEAAERLAPGDRLRGDELIERACAHGRLAFDYDRPRRASTVLRPLAHNASAASIRI